ncbi:MAG: NAD-dependent epimerase/dehydratase family protein [Acidobacteriota bacterium]
MSEKVLVLGGTGFVGRNVMEALRKAQVPCVSSSRAEGSDLRDGAQARALLKRERPSIVVNCAAHVGSLNYVTKQAAEVVVDNTRMILSMYEAVAQESPHTLIINPIANCAYPSTVNTFEEDRWCDGHLHRSVLPYGSTRRMMWSVAECFQMQWGIRSIHLFVPNMYGPYDSTDPNKAHALNALLAKFVKAQATGLDEIIIWGSGIAIREWLYAEDFARIVLFVVRQPNMVGLSEPLNIAQNFGLSVRELVGLVLTATGFSGRVAYDHSMPDGAPRKVMDDRRFRKLFPDFRFTPLSEGIDVTRAYYSSLGSY